MLGPTSLLMSETESKQAAKQLDDVKNEGGMVTIPVRGGDIPLPKAKQNYVNRKMGTDKIVLAFKKPDLGS